VPPKVAEIIEAEQLLRRRHEHQTVREEIVAREP